MGHYKFNGNILYIKQSFAYKTFEEVRNELGSRLSN